MPYEGEFAQYEPLRRIVNDEKVKELLNRSKIEQEKVSKSNPLQITLADLEPSAFRPTHIIAIDGSVISSTLKDGYPGAEIGYVTVASVIINLSLLDKLEKFRPINPVEYRNTEKANSIDSILPGCNIVIDNERSAKSSLRRVLYEVLKETRLFENGESLLDTYESLLHYKDDHTQKCPYSDFYDSEDGCFSENDLYKKEHGEYKCSCWAQKTLYSTDALRIHERFKPDGSNQQIYTEIMQVLERLYLVHILRGLEQNFKSRLFRNFAFVLDGPLAVFGQPAWLSQAIKKELQRINKIAKEKGQDLLIIGVEKTGVFNEHFGQLVKTEYKDQDEKSDEIPFKELASHHMKTSLIPPQTACLLTDQYIKRNIIYSESKRPYGHQTYFGRKFFYRTKSGAQVVATLPFLEVEHEDLSQATIDRYPRLSDAMAIFDQFVSSRYPNSLEPIVAAHAEAAIPLNLGKKVLEELARDLMQDSKSQ